MNIGQVCMKIAGRDAGQLCVVVETLEGSFVLVDGNTRRRKCNLKHLEPLDRILEIEEGASTENVLEAMKEAGLPVPEKKKATKEKKKKEKPTKKRRNAPKPEAAKEEKPKKTPAKKK